MESLIYFLIYLAFGKLLIAIELIAKIFILGIEEENKSAEERWAVIKTHMSFKEKLSYFSLSFFVILCWPILMLFYMIVYMIISIDIDSYRASYLQTTDNLLREEEKKYGII